MWNVRCLKYEIHTFKNIHGVFFATSPYVFVFQLPGKDTNFKAVWNLIKSYKAGYTHLGIALPVTILRGFFFLLVCFEVASVLEVCFP